jgi:hypothetical protein
MKASFRLLRDMLFRRGRRRGRVLFVGQSYYNGWYLSRELRKLGWVADLVDFDNDPRNAMFYHGRDFTFVDRSVFGVIDQLLFYPLALFRYEIFFFANTDCLKFGNVVSRVLGIFGKGADVRLLKLFGRKIFYGNNGCLDGVSQSAFGLWGPYKVCDSCPLQHRADVCSDERNLAWGRLRNSLADYQCLLGGNRADFNVDPRVHESPWFYCLDRHFWTPDLLVPSNYRLPFARTTVKLYHAVGNFEARSHGAGKIETIKSTHIYLPLVERLRTEGYDVEMIFFKDVPNQKIRYYQAQADVVLEMLTYGWFGANAREAMMLGKPVVCFLRPEWLESMRRELPEYVDELPIVNATPETIDAVLRDLLDNPARRIEIGRRSREFAEKWHASDRAAVHFDRVFNEILGRPVLAAGPSGAGR